ncbi:MAG TPA: hypothetical protein VK871_08185, partial [Candidatus Limnocylindrales bacterium]|nr:hypothetical protein [Candidatus Limnocylindrales bacterium]
MTDTRLRAAAPVESAPASSGRALAGRGTLVQRLRAGALTVLSGLACRLPEGPQVALAELAGGLWYRIAPARAARARENLRRIVTHLVATGAADARTRAAEADARTLERLVRSAFVHNAR